MEMKLTAVIKTEGFKPSEIKPRKMWSKLQEDFLELYNDYCEISNGIIPQLNEEWNSTHPATEEEDKEGLTPEEAEIADLRDKLEMLQYAIFMAEAFERCAFEANQRHPDSYIEGFIAIDGDLPCFYGRIKQHPECTLSFAIAEN